MSAEEMSKQQFEVLNFSSPWKELVGNPAGNFDMMLFGEPGSGKTTFLLRFAGYLANHGKVLYVSSEEFGSVTLTQKINELLNPIPQNLLFAKALPASTQAYDFIILDSINDLGMSLPDYKELRNKNNTSAFILVLQATKDGQFRGGKDWEHEVEIAGKVEKGVINIYKNRYGPKGNLNFFKA